MKKIFFIFVVLLVFESAICASDCNTLKTCGECIGYANTKCVWCAKDAMKAHRCETEEYANKNTSWCPNDFLYNPESKINITLDNDFKSTRKGGDVIQFKPQVVDIKARPGIPVHFQMSYKPAKDFPIDVYFLMDTSYSMKTFKDELRNQASDIYQKLVKLSNNVQLGIGSFVEKPGYPYYDKNQKDKNGNHLICYTFKNNLALTTNVSQFENVINDIPFGANYDDLEAGFDALMQVISCDKEEIGWRNYSRRIVVYVTDSSYHSVGDGKMIGIIKPNDMKCHLKDGIHETALSLDYPSVSQINLKALENKVKIIFVVKPIVKDAYEALEKYILDSKYEELKTNSKTADIIERAYKDLSVSVALDRRDWPSFVELELDPDCKSSSQSNCKITPEKPVFYASATFKVNSCPKEKFYKLEIGPRAATDILKINLEIDCECDCEKIKSAVSRLCNDAGVYQCGVCKCNEGYYGDDCGCLGGTDASEEDFEKCLANTDDIKPCSGNAICRCGKCGECVPGFSGEFCQYDNSACARFNNMICAGHGNCTLGSCQCEGFWIKDDCSCDSRKDNCIAPYSTEVCSGHGNCECGECVCHKIKEGKDETFSGKYCDSCEKCAEKRCKELEDYVHCYYVNGTCDEFLNQKSRTRISTVNITEFQSPPSEWRGAKRCEKLLDSKESIIFMFRTDESTGKLHILVQKELEPPNKANIIIAVCSSIAAIILIGLLTIIIWKVLIDLHDAREYQKFADQAKAEGYDVSTENPLYEEPTSNFRNPAYDENLH